MFQPEGRPDFDNADWWMGDTRYRWDGDTLVADVAALTDQVWLDGAGNFHSTEVHIVERYRMTTADTLEYEAKMKTPSVPMRHRDDGSSRRAVADHRRRMLGRTRWCPA